MRTLRQRPSRPSFEIRIQVSLVGHVDDVNSLSDTDTTCATEQSRVVVQMYKLLEEAAHKEHLRWDPDKESWVSFAPSRAIESTKARCILINSRVDFQPHVDQRTQKGKSLLGAMTRLGNSNGGLSPSAVRDVYTGPIRPISTWGEELWNGNHNLRAPNIQRMVRLEDQALKIISIAYHGASQPKLGWIAGVEPLQIKLDDISVSWAARAVRTGDPHIRAMLSQKPPEGWTSWHDGSGRQGFKMSN